MSQESSPFDSLNQQPSIRVRYPARLTSYLLRSHSISISEQFEINELTSKLLAFTKSIYESTNIIAYILAIIKGYESTNQDNSRENVMERIAFLKTVVLSYIGFIKTKIRLASSTICMVTSSLFYEGDDRVVYSPKRNRRIVDIHASRIPMYFRFKSATQLIAVKLHWRIPTFFVHHTRHRYNGEECLLIFLAYFATGSTFTHLADAFFGGDSRYFSWMMECIVDHLYANFYNKIAGNSLSQWIPSDLDDYRLGIYNKLVENQESLRERLNISYSQFRIFAFMDDTDFRTCRPSSSNVNVNTSPHDYQRSFYSGYYRAHGLKAQTIVFPNGLFGSVFITSIRHNDNGVLNMSGISDYLTRLLVRHPIPPVNYLPAVYCDGIFSPRACIVPRYVSPNPHQAMVNRLLSPLRVFIENSYGDVKNLWRIFQKRNNFNLLREGCSVRKACTMIFFVHNCYLCLNETRSNYFQLRAPTLEEYLPLDEVLEEAPDMD